MTISELRSHLKAKLSSSTTEVQCWDLSNGTSSCLKDSTCYYTGADGQEGSFPVHSQGDVFVYVGFGIAGVAILVAACGGLYLFKNRDKPVLKLSQYQFLLVFALAFVVLNMSLLLQLVAYLGIKHGICLAYYLFFYTSQFAMLCILVLKTWRAWKLLVGTQRLVRVKITNKFLYIVLACVESIVLVILILWFTLDAPNPNPCVSLNCSSVVSPFEIILFSLVLVAVVVTFVIAFIGRNVPSIAGESRGIMHTLLVVFLGFIAMMVIISLPLKDTIKTFSFTIYMMVVTVAGMWFLIFKKAKYFDLDSDDLRKRFLKAATSSSRSSPSSVDDKDDARDSIGSEDSQDSRPESQPFLEATSVQIGRS